MIIRYLDVISRLPLTCMITSCSSKGLIFLVPPPKNAPTAMIAKAPLCLFFIHIYWEKASNQAGTEQKIDVN